MKEKIEIPLSKNKLLLGLGGSILFVALGISLFLNADSFQENSSSILRNARVVKGVGILGILFFSLTGIFGIKKLFDTKAGLIIDSSGITNNSNASSLGLIEWTDITDIITKQVMSTKLLLIKVKNPDEYIAKEKGKMNSKLMRSNMKIYGTPLSISSNTLKYDFKKLEQLIQTEFARNKGR